MTGESVTAEQIRSPRALFAHRFTELYEAAGNPTLRRVAATAETRMRAAAGARPGGASAQRISDWKAGRNVPARFESLLPVVLTLADLARKAGHPLTRELAEPREWQRLWQSATTWNPEADTEAACPYPGLTSYRSDDSALFFGRTRATTELTDLVRTTTGIIAVIGASGAGKSSLLAAGLIPALPDWETTTFTPGADPSAALLAALGSAGVAAARAALTPRADGARRLLIVDQFEELFTTCADEHAREDFLTVLRDCATRADDPVAVVVALRADFYAHCLNHLILQDALEHRSYLLGPMRLDELAQAISGPARAVGLELEPGLEELVITELCGAGDHHGRRSYDPGALPLLSHVMAATWQHREGRRLTGTGYRTAGGVVGSVTETAEQAWNELSPAQQNAARDILLGLVTVGQDARDTRRPADRTDLLRRVTDTEAATAALELLSRTRLITLDAEAVTLTHEIVLTAWPRLREWINEDRVGYLVRQRLETDAAEWAAQDRDPSLLYRGTRLQNAADNVDPPPVGPLAREFLTAATASRDHTRRRSTRSKAILAILGVALLVLGFAAYTQTRLVDQQRADKNFADVLAEADRIRETDSSVAAQLDLIAWRMRPGDQRVRSRLLQTQNTPLVTTIAAHAEGISRMVRRSRDGVLATLGYDGSLRLWDTTDAQHPRSLGGQLDDIGTVAFSPDGRTMATTGWSRSPQLAILWDVTVPSAPQRIGVLPDINDVGFSRLEFTPDSGTLVTMSRSHLMLWDVRNPAAPVAGPARRLRADDSNAGIGELRISPNGQLLALISIDALLESHTVQLWDLGDPAGPVLRNSALGGPIASARGLDFSPDGTILAFGSGDGSMREVGSNDSEVHLWDVSDPSRAREFSTFDAGFSGLAALDFAPEGRVLAVGGMQGGGLWNLAEPAYPIRMLGGLPALPSLCRFTARSMPCPGGPSALVFAADGRTLLAGNNSGELRVWSLPPAILTGQAGWVSTPKFDSTGTRMVTASSDGRIVVWDLRNPQLPRRIGEYRAERSFLSPTISPDGSTLIIGATGRDYSLLDISDPAHIKPLPDWRTANFSNASTVLSPDWSMLAAIDADNTVQLWDVSNRAAPTRIGQGWKLSSKHPSMGFGPGNRTMIVRETIRDGAREGDVITLWDISVPAEPHQAGELLRQFGTGTPIFTFTGDMSTLIVADNESLQSWDIRDPARPARLGEPFVSHALDLRSLLLSPDSRTLITSDNDGTVQIWDYSDPAHPTRSVTLAESAHQSWHIALHPDTTMVAAGGADGAIRLWDLNEEHAIDRICAVTGSIWTEELWQRYLPADQPYHPPCD
ncbi:WD40 repeat domain-containing protein [Nocardia sp. NPDC057668]|uniref:WD40 repeat domain-containing protein n=1 Tax=Nocardia sp. NPDC057668 TaxID=3346202 RepID=UPI003671CBD3